MKIRRKPYTTGEAAEVLRGECGLELLQRTIIRMCDKGEIACKREGARRLISVVELRRFAAQYR